MPIQKKKKSCSILSSYQWRYLVLLNNITYVLKPKSISNLEQVVLSVKTDFNFIYLFIFRSSLRKKTLKRLIFFFFLFQENGFYFILFFLVVANITKLIR